MQKKNRKKTLRSKKVSPDNGVSHLSKRDKRRLHLKWRLFVWRSWRQKLRLFRRQRTGSSLCFSWRSHVPNNNLPGCHETNGQNSQVINLGSVWRESDSLPEEPAGSTVSVGAVSQCTSTTDTQRHSEDVAELREDVTTLQQTDSKTWEIQKAHTPEDNAPVELHSSVHSGQNQNPNVCLEKASSCQTDMDPDTLTRDIQAGIWIKYISGLLLANSSTKPRKMFNELLQLCRNYVLEIRRFLRRYGSFVPLRKRDILSHLEGKFNSDFSDWKTLILSAAARYQTALIEMPVSQFQVIYKKHILTLEDLLTLADQNWLNDQVMNMYGELIMESSHHKVHFLNSFFHRQLMTKGYEGVKRWTKQVDLFSKTILLVPVHLEVHWCLVTADVASKKICLYDSQGNALQKVAWNILKYLITEAKEKQQSAYESGWTVSFDEKIPQQTNENDCGVFVLEYSRCLTLSRPFQFTQKDIPKIRKRIYKELCDCRLREQD